MAAWLGTASARRQAGEWFARHGLAAVPYLVPDALDTRRTLRDKAAAPLQIASRYGEAGVVETARRYGDHAAGAVAQILDGDAPAEGLMTGPGFGARGVPMNRPLRGKPELSKNLSHRWQRHIDPEPLKDQVPDDRPDPQRRVKPEVLRRMITDHREHLPAILGIDLLRPSGRGLPARASIPSDRKTFWMSYAYPRLRPKIFMMSSALWPSCSNRAARSRSFS